MGNQHSGQLKTAWMFIRGATTHELLRAKYRHPIPPSPYPSNADDSEMLTRVINTCTDQMNMQLRILGLTLMSARYYINTDTVTAEKTALMGYIGAQKSQDALWQLQGGKILAGHNPFYTLMTEVFVKQDKFVKKEKQDILNEGHRGNAAVPLNWGTQPRDV
jgi:hypothetical protein